MPGKCVVVPTTIASITLLPGWRTNVAAGNKNMTSESPPSLIVVDQGSSANPSPLEIIRNRNSFLREPSLSAMTPQNGAEIIANTDVMLIVRPTCWLFKPDVERSRVMKDIVPHTQP